MKLRISPDISFPSEAVTQTFGVLGKRGSGKTNAGRVVAEEMFRAGVPFCAVDPVGSWWGLRSSRDGKGEGLSLPIFGGDKGDIPLEREAGQLVADLVADQRLSCILDISVFSEGDKRRFLTDFAERLFQRNRDPLHLFLEEADDFIPQRVMGEAARLVGAWQRIVKRGRSRGLGATMITQRSASINKDVLTQCETLLVFRTTSPQDMKAIEGWLQYHGQKTDVLESLPSLRDGECWVWSPHWLEKLVRVRVRLSETFDSGATPTDAKGRRAPATLADVDLGALRDRMTATIQRAKETDPRELRRQVMQLQGELARVRAEKPAPEIQRVEIPILDESIVRRLEATLLESEGVADSVRRAAGAIVESVAQAQRALDAARQVRPLSISKTQRLIQVSTPRRKPAVDQSEGDFKLGAPQRKILTVLAQYPEGRTVTQVAILTGYAVGGGAFRNPLGSLRSAGYIEGQGVIRITETGQSVLGKWEYLPSPGHALFAYWMERLSGPEREILRVLGSVYPRSLAPEEIAQRTVSSKGTPYESEGGAFRNPLGRLRTLELVEGRGEIKLSDDLMAGVGARA